MPDPKTLDLSMFRIDRKSEKEVWEIGNKIRNKPAVARGDLTGLQAKSSGLPVVEDEPPPGHANIMPWPTEKSEQMLIAKKLHGQVAHRGSPST